MKIWIEKLKSINIQIGLRQKFTLLSFAFLACIMFFSGLIIRAGLVGTGISLLVCSAVAGMVLVWLLREVFAGLQEVRGQLAQANHKMKEVFSDASESSFKLSSASAQQSTAIFESVSSLENMESKLSQSVRHSVEALQSSEDSLTEALNGKSVVDNLKSAMTEIERSTEGLEVVNQLVREIGSKTKIINDIVFKTQLLSFNASIEAARAGENGRGFAVVAAEVGKLAEMSGDAAKEINKLLGDSTKTVGDIVTSTKQKVNSANSMSQECATVFERITDRVGQMKSIMNSISDTAAEQEAGMQQVSRAMNDLRTSAGETNRMAHSMSQLSGGLRVHSESIEKTLQSLDEVVLGDQIPTMPKAS